MVVVVGWDNGVDAILFEVVVEVVDVTEEDVRERGPVEEVDGLVDEGVIVLEVRVRQGQTTGRAERTYDVREESGVNVDVVFAAAVVAPDVVGIVESR